MSDDHGLFAAAVAKSLGDAIVDVTLDLGIVQVLRYVGCGRFDQLGPGPRDVAVE